MTIQNGSNCTLKLTNIPQYSLLILELTSDLANCRESNSEERGLGCISFEKEEEDDDDVISEKGDTLTKYFKSSRNTAVIGFLSTSRQQYYITIKYTCK